MMGAPGKRETITNNRLDAVDQCRCTAGAVRVPRTRNVLTMATTTTSGREAIGGG